MSGQLIGATDVLGGGGAVVATSNQGNWEAGSIYLTFGPGGGNGINVGGNYTLRAGNGQTWATVCTYVEGDNYSFQVM